MPESSTEKMQKKQVSSTSESLISVLHVDDDADFLRSSKQILEIQHDLFQVETALSVKEAKKKLEQKPYDVIVSDYQMPETDGLDFLKELRNRGNDVPFILFTGKGREEIAIEALNLGADRYFSKTGKPETVYGELAHSLLTAVKAKRAEKALQESEEKYRKQFENTIDAIFLADAETGILVDCNRAATKLVDRKKSELIGKHQRILHPPEPTKGEFSRSFEQHRKENEAQVVEEHIITKNGELRDVLINATSFTVEGRKLVHGTFRDITENKKIAEQMRRERETLELVTENVGAGLTIISKDYKILWANTFLKNICGAVKGKTCYSVYNDRTSVCPGCGVKKIFEKGTANVVHEQSVPGPDGERVWIEITANPIRDEKGNIIGASELSVNINERKQLESKLLEAENKYHAIFDKTPLGILIIDSNGTAVDFNEDAHRQLGYSREEFEKLNVSDYEVLESPEETRARMNRILKTGKDEFETEHRTKTGEIRNIKNTVQVIDLSGKKFFQVITQDITEQKQAEEALRDNEKNYRAIINAMNDTAWVIGFDGIFIDVNDAAVKALGYTRKELLSMGPKHLSRNMPEENVQALIKNMHKDEIQVFEATHFTKDGHTIPVEISSSLVNYHGKKAILSIARDITDRKKTEEQLKESERKYRLLTENTTDVIYIQDMNLNLTYASPSVEKISGYTPEELLKLTPDKFMTEESFKRGVADFKETITLVAEDQDYEIPLKQYEYFHKDGSTFWGELKMKMLRDSDNNFVGVQGNLRDITERRKAEEKLSRMMKKLMAINEKLGVIGKLTRHDARNKLSTIANNIYLAKQKLATNSNAVIHLNDVESAIDQLEKIFDFARNYELLGVEALSYLDVERNVNEAALLLSCSATVNIMNDCKGLTVMADSLLRQVFYNLIDDTLKYGEKVNQIRVYYEEGANELKLVYADDGVGIPENEKEKIFHEGYGKGTGYGLYLIKKICESYGWTIRETGVPGKGAQFTMTIPKINRKGVTLYRFE